MHNAADYLLSRWSMNIIAFLAAIPMLCAIVLGLQWVQSRYVPVVVDFEVTRFERLAPDKIEIWGNLTKRFQYGDGLPMCRYAEQSWWVRLPDGKLIEARWQTLERPFGQTVNRQPGRQTFGPWILDYSGHADAVEIFGISNHWCLGFWWSSTRLGPLRLRAGI